MTLQNTTIQNLITTNLKTNELQSGLSPSLAERFRQETNHGLNKQNHLSSDEIRKEYEALVASLHRLSQDHPQKTFNPIAPNINRSSNLIAVVVVIILMVAVGRHDVAPALPTSTVIPALSSQETQTIS